MRASSTSAISRVRSSSESSEDAARSASPYPPGGGDRDVVVGDRLGQQPAERVRRDGRASGAGDRDQRGLGEQRLEEQARDRVAQAVEPAREIVGVARHC